MLILLSLIQLATTTLCVSFTGGSLNASTETTRILESSSTVTRYDVSNVWEKNSLKRFEFQSSSLTGLGLKQHQTASVTDTPFLIDFECSASDAICTKARRTFNSSIARISRLLKINTPITVKATFRSFCGSQSLSSCSLARVLGQATSGSYFVAKSELKNYNLMYPQSLIKQLALNKKLTFSQFDIISEFNADYNFWFEGDGPIQPDQTDFSFVIAHELTHGLGFDTNWWHWSSLIQAPFTIPNNFLAPFFISNSNGERDQGNYIVETWNPLHIFDSFVVESSTNKELSSFAGQVYSFLPNGQKAIEFIQGFIGSSRPFQAAKDVYSIITGGSRKIKFNPPRSTLGQNATVNGVSFETEVFLTTDTTYSSGSSIAHLDYDSHYRTSDFLMIPAVQSLTGKTLDEIIANSENPTSYGGIYGPKTLQILGAMGWPTILNDQVISLDIQDDVYVNPSNSATRTGIVMSCLLLAAALFL